MAPGDRDEVSNGELMRGLLEIKALVKEQGGVITSIDRRVVTIEATQAHAVQTAQTAQTHATQAMQAALAARREGERSGGRSVVKPLGYGGLGATLLGVIQWMISHWPKG